MDAPSLKGPVRPVCGLTDRILHVHPGLGCNLTCRHCYSSSGPAAKTRLSSELVCAALSDAAKLGFRAASFSGGEPLMQAGLWEMLAHARAVGLRVSVITNGTLITTDAVAARLRDHADLMAFSLDGPPEQHNEMRASPLAFERMLAGVRRVRATGMKFGFTFTLTEATWEHLVWAAEFAREQGASLLRIHPLELSGRGVVGLNSLAPSDETLAKAYLLTQALEQEYAPDLSVQIDLLHADHVRARPELVHAGADAGEGPNLLVLQADGLVVPFSHGFSPEYALGHVQRQPLRELFTDYLATGYGRLQSLCHRVYHESIAPRDFPLFNWYDLIVRESLAAPEQSSASDFGRPLALAA